MKLSMKSIKSFVLLPAVAVIASIAFSSVTVFAQTGTLEVTCEGPSGAPEKDVRVDVMLFNANKGSNKKTDASGKAIFDKLNNGLYRVFGRKDGYAPALYEAVFVNNDKSSVALKLTVGADGKLYFEDKALEGRSNELLEEGIKAIGGGAAAEAEQLIAQSLAIKPFAPDALFYNGMAQIRLGKYDDAEGSFKKAADTASLMLSSMPKPKPTGEPGGSPMDRQQAVYEMLVTNSQQQLALIPVIKAEAAYEAKRFDEAVALYDEAIKNNPQNSTLYSNRALVQAQIGNLDDAVASINKALELEPGDERAGQIKKAVDAFVENAAREKENERIKQANDLINEGTKLLDSDASAALKKFEEANALTDEKQAMVWRQVGRARAKLNQDTEAVAAFKKAIELAPVDLAESYQMSLAQYYLDAKRPEDALDVVVAGSKDPEQRLMDLFTKGKNNPDSMAFSTAALERVVQINPSNIDAVFELGQVYYIDRKDVQARELLSKYIESGKDEDKIQRAKDFITVMASRNKPKS